MMARSSIHRLVCAAALLLGVRGAAAQSPASRPFGPGERMTYEVRFGALRVGTGSMEVRAIERVRNRPAYHTMFQFQGGIVGFRVDDLFESWFAVDDLASLRFHKRQDEGPRETSDRYEIFPERRTYDDLLDAKGEQASVTQPLDDGSFLYFIRTVPLTVGQTYTFNRYFKPNRNPVTIQVLRRERITVPGGLFDAIVVRPTIQTSGLFSKGGEAEVWLSDDERRLVIQVKSKLAIGSFNMYLTSYRAGAPD